MQFFLKKYTINLMKKNKIDFAVGGQAVIEGIMMRSPNSIVIAVRKTDGKIKIKKRKYHTVTQRYKWLNIPILRGVINLFEMMGIGAKSINYSANEQFDEEEIAKYSKKTQNFFNKALEILMFIFSFVLALGLALFLFKFLPLWVTTFLETKSSAIEQNYLLFNLIDGLLKVTIFLLYVFLLTLIPSFRRIFEYHGAEHKSIYAYEKGLDLIPKNAARQSRFHPRCGTSFILIVFVISIIVYTFVPKQPEFWANLGVRIAFLPLIAGIAYEFLKLSAKYSNNVLMKAFVAPGLWFQRLTTKEPSKEQLEVGLKALEEALKMEKTLKRD